MNSNPSTSKERRTHGLHNTREEDPQYFNIYTPRQCHKTQLINNTFLLSVWVTLVANTTFSAVMKKLFWVSYFITQKESYVFLAH
jgi:hypothetical protein